MFPKLPLAAAILAACFGFAQTGALHAADTPAPAEAPAANTPDATVMGWIAVFKNNDPASFLTKLPTARQLELADGWKAMTAETGQGQQAGGGGGQGQQGGPGRRGGGRMTMMLDQPLKDLQAVETAANVARTLASLLAQFAVVVQPSSAPAPAMPAPPEGQPWMQFVQRGMAQRALIAILDNVLASGLETRQIAGLQGLFDDYSAWAAKGLDDPTKSTAAAEHLVAMGAALQLKGAADLAAVDLKELLTRCNTALPAFKKALAAFGLDADAMLASATVKTETATATDSVVVVTFKAFAKSHELPLKLKKAANGWEIAADSPTLRWLRVGMQGGMPGNMRGGRQGGGQGGGQGGAQGGGQPATPATPAPPAGEPNF